ncbi:MAG: hypothetical protein AB1650_08425 [Candidatus Omnitrophota bacterium]
MSQKVSAKQTFSLILNSIFTLFKNPQILYPFGILAFIQLLIMEVLFFAPRNPLSFIFKPIITRLKGEAYLHYPLNFDLMNHWFQSLQVVIFLFITSYLMGKAILMIASVNQDKPIGDKMPALGLRKYLGIVLAFFFFFLLIHGLTSIYGLLIHRAVQIRSTSGIYFYIKQAVLVGAPYFNLLFSIMVTALFAYVVPVIVLEAKNVFIAIGKNFQILWLNLLPTFGVVFLTSMIYVPILLIRSNEKSLSVLFTPETWQLTVIAGIFILLFIEAMQYTAITTCYLLTKDE